MDKDDPILLSPRNQQVQRAREAIAKLEEVVGQFRGMGETGKTETEERMIKKAEDRIAWFRKRYPTS